MGVTGRDGSFRLEFPMGRVYVALSRAVHQTVWLGVDQEVEITLRSRRGKR